jgi:hypothetical protein
MRFFDKKFYNQDFKEAINYNLESLLTKKLLINICKVSINNKKNAQYNYTENTINIPYNFFKTNSNYLQYQEILRFFKTDKKTIEFIVKHEAGHLAHHPMLNYEINKNNNDDSFYYNELRIDSDVIKCNKSIDIF